MNRAEEVANERARTLNDKQKDMFLKIVSVLYNHGKVLEETEVEPGFEKDTENEIVLTRETIYNVENSLSLTIDMQTRILVLAITELEILWDAEELDYVEIEKNKDFESLNMIIDGYTEEQIKEQVGILCAGSVFLEARAYWKSMLRDEYKEVCFQLLKVMGTSQYMELIDIMNHMQRVYKQEPSTLEERTVELFPNDFVDCLNMLLEDMF